MVWGYCKGEDGASQPIPHEAETVERIYRYFLSGDSIGTIKKSLEQDKIPSKKGGESWSQSVIKGILNSEKYCDDAICKSHLDSISVIRYTDNG